MEKHECHLEADVSSLKKIIVGNGSKGLLASVASLTATSEHLKEGIISLNETTDKLVTSTNAMVRFVSEMQGAEKQKAKMESRVKWLIGINVTLVLGIVGFVLTLVTK